MNCKITNTIILCCLIVAVSSFSKFPVVQTTRVCVRACVWSVGKGLCMLTKEDCRQRAPFDGDVVYNILNMWINNLSQADDGLVTYLFSLAIFQ